MAETKSIFQNWMLGVGASVAFLILQQVWSMRSDMDVIVERVSNLKIANDRFEAIKEQVNSHNFRLHEHDYRIGALEQQGTDSRDHTRAPSQVYQRWTRDSTSSGRD